MTKKDFYIYDRFSKMMYACGLSYNEAVDTMKEIAQNYPSEVKHFVMASISDDPTTAANFAFAHIANGL